MVDPQIQIELRKTEDKLRSNYSKVTLLFLLISIIMIICIALVFIGISLGYGYNWALFGLDGWIIVLIILFSVFILLELIFYYHFTSIHNKIMDLEKPKPEFVNGKRVYIFTFPDDKEGGVFSKTYIEIDDHSVLRLRSLMIPPEEL